MHSQINDVCLNLRDRTKPAACAAIGHVAGGTIAEFQRKAEFMRITNAGLRESHVHDVAITRESPNYHPTGV